MSAAVEALSLLGERGLDALEAEADRRGSSVAEELARRLAMWERLDAGGFIGATVALEYADDHE